MFDLRPNPFGYYVADRPVVNNHAILLHGAIKLYNSARQGGIIERAKSALTGRSYQLFSLSAIPSGQVRARHYAGIKCVNLSQICGSMNRTRDFDHHFHPLDDRLRDRWLSIAMTRSQYIPLPPISLIQISSCYFVEDGHHRVSVAHALGETAIDAEVTIWEVSGPLPWETQKTLRPIWRTA